MSCFTLKFKHVGGLPGKQKNAIFAKKHTKIAQNVQFPIINKYIYKYNYIFLKKAHVIRQWAGLAKLACQPAGGRNAKTLGHTVASLLIRARRLRKPGPSDGFANPAPCLLAWGSPPGKIFKKIC
jgi:hypothetical protein